MAGYRCYVLDAEDHILQAHDLDCESDEHAATIAESFLDRDPYYSAAEVWLSTRRIAKLERQASNRSTISNLKTASANEGAALIGIAAAGT
jgi:hypothetical protein